MTTADKLEIDMLIQNINTMKTHSEKMDEAYLNKDYEVEEPKRVSKRKPPINMSEKNKCLYYGISCSYGICDECEIHNKRSGI